MSLKFGLFCLFWYFYPYLYLIFAFLISPCAFVSAFIKMFFWLCFAFIFFEFLPFLVFAPFAFWALFSLNPCFFRLLVYVFYLFQKALKIICHCKTPTMPPLRAFAECEAIHYFRAFAYFFRFKKVNYSILWHKFGEF